MTVKTMVLSEEDPYEGLWELSAQVWRLVLKRFERLRAWRRIVPIRGGAPGVFDDIAYFLRTLQTYLNPAYMYDWLRWKVWDPFMGWLRAHFLNPLLEYLMGLQERLLGWWAGAVDSIKAHLTYLKNSILGWWHGAWESLKGHLWAIKDSILGWWHGAWESLKGHLTWLKDSLLGWWYGAINWILGHLTSLKDSILGWWQGAIDRIHGAIESLRAFLHDPLEGLRQIWQRFQETWAGQLLSSLITGLSTLWNMIVAALRELWARYGPLVIETAEKAIAFGRPYLERLFEGIVSLPGAYLDLIASLSGTNLALQPSRALTTVGAVSMLALAAGTTASVTSTALTFIPQFKPTAIQQLAGFVAQAAGFEEIKRASYGVLLQDVLAWPLRYHWHQQLRPRIPTEGTIFLMGRKRGLDRAEFGQAMAYHGIPDWWIDKISLYFWTDPSPYWLLRMSEAANPMIKPSAQFLPWLEKWLPGWRSDPWAWYKMKLMLAGFEDTDLPAFIEGFQARLIKPAVTQVKTSIRAMLREAYWGRAEAEAALRPLKVRQDEIELLIVAEELDYQKRYLDDDVRYFKEAFRKGEIDLQDLSLALSTIIVKPERVAQEVARERVRAMAKPKPITQPKEDPLVTSLRRQAINSWTKQYRDWLIEEEDLLLGLTIVTQDPQLAAEMVAVEVTRYRPVPVPPPPPPEDPIVAKSRRQAIASWVTAFRKGEIDSAELELYLEPLIPDRETRLQIVHLESLRYTPTPELIPLVSEDPELAKIRKERVAGHITMFQKRLIGLEQLYTFLLADGLVEALARATVITQANKRIRVPPLDSPYFLKDVIQDLIDQGLLAYEEMFVRGDITIDHYTAWLTGIGVDPDVVTYLADTLTLRRFLEGL